MHALIIEDETYTAQMLQFALSDTGFNSFEIVMSDAEANDDRSLAQQIDRAALREVPTAEYAPREVKQAVVGHGRHA